MKIFIKFLMFVVVLGVAGLFFIKNPEGKPWLQIDYFIPDVEPIINTWNNLKQGDLAGAPKTITGKTQVYRWQDSAGTWQYSDEPPTSGNADEIWIDPDTNVIQSPKREDTQQSVAADTANSAAPSIPLPMTIAPDQVSKLIDDAKAVSDLMEQRNKDLETVLPGSGQR